MSTDFGWTQHLDKRGTPCVYCGEPSTETLVVEPDEYAKGELKRRGKRVGVCDAHMRPAEDVSAAVNFRRRHAKNVEQLSMTDEPRSNSAIYGNEAA